MTDPDRRGEQLFTPVPETRETVMLNAIEGPRERAWLDRVECA